MVDKAFFEALQQINKGTKWIKEKITKNIASGQFVPTDISKCKKEFKGAAEKLFAFIENASNKKEPEEAKEAAKCVCDNEGFIDPDLE